MSQLLATAVKAALLAVACLCPLQDRSLPAAGECGAAELARSERSMAGPSPPQAWLLKTVSRGSITVCSAPVFAPRAAIWVPRLSLSGHRTMGVLWPTSGRPRLEASLDGRSWLEVPCEWRGGLRLARGGRAAWLAVLPRAEPRGRQIVVWFRVLGSGEIAPALVDI